MKLSDRSPWIIRTYAGFGDAEASNERYRANLARGQRGLSVAFDLPTQNGYDSDHAMAAGEVGGTGVAVCHLGDMEALFDQIDLGAINTSMTINATAPWLFALYLALAQKKGVAFDALRGTTQNDLMKEFGGRGTYVFEPRTSLRLATDLITYAAENVLRWNPINVCGYHYMESGATPAQEVGLAMGNAVLILDAIQNDISTEAFERVVNRFSFFINSGIELVTEIAKVRAYAQLWSELCQNEYGVSDVRFRAGCQVRSLTLTAQQPEVNIVRIAYQALPVVLSQSARVGALQLPGFREAIDLPDETEQTLSLRTQQVLMYETDIADHGDIFEGSKVVEGLTESIKAEARATIRIMRDLGYQKTVPWLSELLTESLVRWRARIEAGEQIQVGVNAFLEPVGLVETTPRSRAETNGVAVDRHIARLTAHRNARDDTQVKSAIFALQNALAKGNNIMPASIQLAQAGGTTGEWTQTVETYCGGRYNAPLGIDGGKSVPLDVPKASKTIRFVLGKSGLDGHVNAVKLLAVACARAGMEVIYTGIKQSPEALVAGAIQEDADVLGISSLSGAHLHIAKEVLACLANRGAADLPVVMGGIIPDADRTALLNMGIRAVFTPKDSVVGDIVAQIITIAG